MRINYDKDGDFLEIFIGESRKSYAREVKPGVFLRINEKTEEVTSVEIIGFKKRVKELKNGINKTKM